MTHLVPYSFDEIQDIMRQEAIDSDLVSDAEYEGSNIAQMIRVMSYAAQSCNINATYGVNEMLLTQTTEYNNALKLARQLGYIPKQQISYRYLLKIRPNIEGSYSIPKYSEFVSGNYSYYYFGTDIDRIFQYYVVTSFNTDVTTVTLNPGDKIILSNMKEAIITEILPDPDNDIEKRLLKLEFSGNIEDSDTSEPFKICTPQGNLIIEGVVNTINDTRFEELEIKEGILHKHYDENENLDGEKDLFKIIEKTMENDPSTPLNYLDYNYYNIEEDGIDMWVTHFDNTGQLRIKEPWNKRDYFIVDKDIFEENSTFLPLVDIDLNTLRLYFTIADTGITPKLYSKVYVNLLETHGELGKANKPFGFVTLKSDIWYIDNPDELIIKTYGKNIEGLEEVRINAPTFHNTGNRAVTRLDYISICNRDNGIDATQVWGGETNIPNQNLGHVFFSFLPSYRPLDFVYNTAKTSFKLNKVEHSDAKFNLKEDEIRAVTIQNNSNIDDSTLGIFDILDSYKIITLAHHHRWNYFVDMDLVVDIRKYYITQSVGSVNYAIHKEIVNYFHEVVESYDYDFFRSNIVRIIDEQLGITTGLELKLSTTIPLYENHLERVFEGSNIFKNDIWFGFPFDGVLDEYGTFSNKMIPNIDTDNFLRDDLGNELYIAQIKQSGGLIGDSSIFLGDEDKLEINIYYGTNKDIIRDSVDQHQEANSPSTIIQSNYLIAGVATTMDEQKVGTCIINMKDKTILIRLFSRNTDASLPTNCFSSADIQDYIDTIINVIDYTLIDPITNTNRNELRINLKYPFNDINFHKNTIARLNSIEFI